MADLTSRQRRWTPPPWLRLRAGSGHIPFWSGWGAVFYGRALRLPPPALPRHAYIPDHPIAAGLRPYRRRLYRQRAVVTLLRTLILAVVVALAVLVVRMRGTAVPIPLAPLVAAGAVLVAGIVAALVQRPSPAQMAHALDRRLGLREQIGSALELGPGQGYLADLLRQRAAKALREANFNFVLPWPSLRRERYSLLGLVPIVAVCGLIAVNSPLARPVASAPAGPGGAGAHTKAKAALHGGILPLGLHTLGATARSKSGSSAHGRRGLGATRGNGTGRGTTGQALSGQALSLHAGQGQGKAGPVGAHGKPTTGAQQSGAGAPNGKGGSLHLTSGKNSSAGGVVSQAQQAMTNLQNSISAASGPQGKNGQQSGNTTPGQNGQQQGQGGGQNQNQGHGRAGGKRSGQSGQHNAKTGRRGSPGQRTGSEQSGHSNAANNGAGGALNGPNGLEGDAMDGRFGRHGAYSGSGIDQNSKSQSTPGQHAGASLGQSGQITLNGASGPGGRMVLTYGLPNRGVAQNPGSIDATGTAPVLTVPGYVAPDSNTVPPDERSMVQGYFSPPPQ